MVRPVDISVGLNGRDKAILNLLLLIKFGLFISRIIKGLVIKQILSIILLHHPNGIVALNPL